MTSIQRSAQQLRQQATLAPARAGSRSQPDGEMVPLLRTARRLRRSMAPVDPSPSFRTGLEDELLQVAGQLPRYARGLPTVMLEENVPNERTRTGLSVGAVLLGVATGLTILICLRRRSAAVQRRT